MTAPSASCGAPSFGPTAAEVGALLRYVGDDWLVGPLTLSHNGVPVDLTGSTVTALFYQSGAVAPVAILTETAGITMPLVRTTGVITQIKLPKTVTATVPVQDRTATTWPTRLQVEVTDSNGNTRTYALVLFLPLDPRSDVPPVTAP